MPLRRNKAIQPTKSTMTLKELLKNYPDHDLETNNGNPSFRRSVWTPFFVNLHEGKLVYRERFVCLARIEELKINEDGVWGTVVPLNYFYTRPSLVLPSRPWRFGGSWGYMSQGEYTLSAYSSWSIWPEVPRVRAVAALLEKGDPEGALELVSEW